MDASNIRVRFAPSPTGPLHIGGVRTALYNYLFAKKNGGKFILRIEDTDQTRFVPQAEKYIIESLKWCGLSPEEGIDENGKEYGPYGPYRQSDRKDIYPQYVEQLLASDNAYYAFDTPEELDALRKECEARKDVFVYNAQTRKSLKNSLTLPQEEVKRRIAAGEHYVVRFKIPENTDVPVHDLIREDITFHTKELDDKVLFKSDGMPTYHLANIVDDHLMKITHVIRGEEWLPSMPLHVLLYKAFGWQAPQFAHLPLILKPTGNGKLSKRDGDQLGFPVFPLEWHAPNGEVYSGYREKGYLPGAFINMLALLGWNSGTEQEIFSMEELIAAFSLEKVGKSGSRFDPDKTRWFNAQYMKMLSDDDFYKLSLPVLASNDIKDSDFARKAVLLIKDRCAFASDVMDNAGFFFYAPESYDPDALKKRWKEGTGTNMEKVAAIIEAENNFTVEALHDKVMAFIADNGLNMGQIMNSIRLAVVGQTKGPDMFTIIVLLGKQETLARLRRAVSVIGI